MISISGVGGLVILRKAYCGGCPFIYYQENKTTFLLLVAINIDRKIPGDQEQLVTLTFTEICS